MAWRLLRTGLMMCALLLCPGCRMGLSVVAHYKALRGPSAGACVFCNEQVLEPGWAGCSLYPLVWKDPARTLRVFLRGEKGPL